MKLNKSDQSIIGNADLGAGAAQRWSPRDYNFYDRQWRTQRGAWGDPSNVVDRLQEDVNAIIDAFQTRGTAAGLIEARNRGLLEAARLYLAIRADTEEELAARLAKVRARLAVAPSMLLKLQEAFLVARLEEVRKAVSAGHTPPQAVIDKPQIPRRQVPRWVSYGALILSAIALIRSFNTQPVRRRRELEDYDDS